jgi:hypothetical protein
VNGDNQVEGCKLEVQKQDRNIKHSFTHKNDDSSSMLPMCVILTHPYCFA